MHNLLRCRRGSAAFATVAAMVPLIGVVALGGEAGSWYVTKQHAQNAADAAAYSGALWVACSDPTKCDKAQDYVYRGKQFAARNAFCNAGDSSIRAPIVPLRFRQVRRRPCRSISRPAIAFVPLLASTSQDICQECLVCFRTARHPRSSHRPSPEPERTMFFGTLTDLQSAAVAP